MIILDLRLKKYISKFEIFKVFLHVAKICIMFELEFRIQTNKSVVNLTKWRNKSLRNSKLIIIMKPETRIVYSNLGSLIATSLKITKPTIIISQLIYQHANNDLHKIYLPKVSNLIIKKFNYINEIQILAGLTNHNDINEFVDFNRKNMDKISEFRSNIKYESFDFPVKVIKKRHEYIPFGRDLFDNFNISESDKLNDTNNMSVIIPTTLNTVANHFKFSSLISQVSNLLNSMNINFEIILVIGPEVNSFELNELERIYPEIIIVTNKSIFNFSRRVNDGLAVAKHELMWILNDDIRIGNHESAEDDLLIAMQLAKKPTTGIIGTFLMEGGLINHAGIQIHDEIADHVLRGAQFSNLEAMNSFRVREVIGVTGANIFFLKNTIQKLGNFDETFPLEFSDVELCLRANKNGLQNYIIRTKNFIHFESSTRENSLDPRHQLLRALTKYDIEYKEDPYMFTVPYCCLEEMVETSHSFKKMGSQGLVRK